MRQETRFKFNAYLSRVAELNGIDAGDVSKKFTVEPSVTQTLMNTMQESSDFLTRINIVPVSEMKGEKIGIGVTGSIASTTDTAGGTERQPKDFSKLASNKYECDQINFDFYIRYKTLDLWARYQDFQLRIRNAITRLLTETLELTAAADMPDEVRAKLHKITGLFLRDGGDAAGALAHLQRATQLDCQAGVKKEIERLERELKPKPEPQPKAATRAPRKTRSATPAKRGRPKKKAS